MKKIIFLTIFILISMTMILISSKGIFAEMKIRDTPSKQKFKKADIENIVKDKNFYDRELNKKGDWTNDFVDNGDGTITDKATGLMWEQNGSKKPGPFYIGKKHVKKLNKKKFAGHNDWRMPTIEELYSILEPHKSSELFINPLFSATQYHCWSADQCDLPSLVEKDLKKYLTIDYKSGKFDFAHTGVQPGGSSSTKFSSYARAVRTIK